MKVFNFEQGSEEWVEARRGVLTASTFSDVITPAKMGLAAARHGLINKTLAEIQAPGDPQWAGNFATDRGTEYEEEARNWFEFDTGLEVEQVGFIRNGLLGASPDALVADWSGLEIKCPLGHTHVGYLRSGEIPDAYKAQVHGNMIVSGREHWHFLSYHPDFDPLLVEVEKDKFTETLGRHLVTVQEELKEAAKKLGIELPSLHATEEANA